MESYRLAVLTFGLDWLGFAGIGLYGKRATAAIAAAVSAATQPGQVLLPKPWSLQIYELDFRLANPASLRFRPNTNEYEKVCMTAGYYHNFNLRN